MANDLKLNVFISNPERKKERTDADANDREVYVAGLSKFVTKDDLEKLFKTVSQPLFSSQTTCVHSLIQTVWSLERSEDDNGSEWPFKRLCLCRVRE